jgi:hypothetical protein
MNSRNRPLFYILLNIAVSTLVTGTILFIYNRVRQKDCNTNLPGVIPGTTSPADINVTIVGVNGAGVADNESVMIQNNGSSSLALTGWTLKNNLGVSFTFPQLILFPGGSVQVHTKSGSDTAADLYWQLSEPAWSSGELAALYDDRNIVRSFYRVP